MHERLAILNQRQLWLPVIGLWLILSGVAAFAASPQFNGANPWGVQRGKETEVVISGERLADAQRDAAKRAPRDTARRALRAR